MPNSYLYCRTITLNGVEGFVRSHGHNLNRVLKQVNLSPAHLGDSEGFISWNAVCDLMERLSHLPDLDNFGIRWARAVPTDFRHVGPMLHLASLSKTGRDFLNLAARYHRVHKNGMSHHVIHDAENESVRWQLRIAVASVPCHQMVAFSLANTYRQTKMFFPKTVFLKVCFAFPEPEDAALYRTYFSCPLEFDAPFSELVTEDTYMDKPLEPDLKGMRQAIKGYLKERADRAPKASELISETIRAGLPALFGVNHTDASSIAALYGLSPKKLQRLLKDERTTYSAIRDDVRRALAKRLLLQTPIPISRLAIFLDYNSSRAFHQACLRWFDKSPRELRQGTTPKS